MLKRTFLFFISFIVLLAHCAYTPGEALPKNYRTVYIASFINDTDEADLPELLSESVTRDLDEDGTLTVITDIEKSDVLLAVRIGKFTKTIVTYTEDTHLPDEMLMAVEIKFVVQDVHTKEILRSQIIEDSISYHLITDPVKTDIDAKNELIELLSQKITLSTVKGFY